MTKTSNESKTPGGQLPPMASQSLFAGLSEDEVVDYESDTSFNPYDEPSSRGTHVPRQVNPVSGDASEHGTTAGATARRAMPGAHSGIITNRLDEAQQQQLVAETERTRSATARPFGSRRDYGFEPRGINVTVRQAASHPLHTWVPGPEATTHYRHHSEGVPQTEVSYSNTNCSP